MMNLAADWTAINSLITENIGSFLPYEFPQIYDKPVDPNTFGENLVYWGLYSGTYDNKTLICQTAFVFKFVGDPAQVIDGFRNFVLAYPNLQGNATLINITSFEVAYQMDEWCILAMDADIYFG